VCIYTCMYICISQNSVHIHMASRIWRVCIYMAEFRNKHARARAHTHTHNVGGLRRATRREATGRHGHGHAANTWHPTIHLWRHRDIRDIPPHHVRWGWAWGAWRWRKRGWEGRGREERGGGGRGTEAKGDLATFDDQVQSRLGCVWIGFR
jgi:hypothetical protein